MRKEEVGRLCFAQVTRAFALNCFEAPSTGKFSVSMKFYVDLGGGSGFWG